MAAEHTPDTMIAAVRAMAAHGEEKHVSRARFLRESGACTHQIVGMFGNYGKFLLAAGLAPYSRNRKRNEDELFTALRDAWNEEGGPVSQTTYDRMKVHRYPCYQRRWKTWSGVLTAFLAWIEGNDPGFAHLKALREVEERHRRREPLRRQAARLYGETLDLPHFRHAPTHEQGVVLLFGMLAERLGYIIERAGPGFPDCDAKRRLPGGDWQGVRLEFEMESRNFRIHGHDAAACDLIVCWEHNWADCPLEVLELKSEIGRLRAVSS
jgi:hypothetical protein